MTRTILDANINPYMFIKLQENGMIKSMTGFGRCEVAEHDRKFTVELKSVNHRYLDVSIKMPKKLGFFERCP